MEGSRPCLIGLQWNVDLFMSLTPTNRLSRGPYVQSIKGFIGPGVTLLGDQRSHTGPGWGSIMPTRDHREKAEEERRSPQSL